MSHHPQKDNLHREEIAKLQLDTRKGNDAMGTNHVVRSRRRENHSASHSRSCLLIETHPFTSEGDHILQMLFKGML